jgi:class 3 adenylate cyclase
MDVPNLPRGSPAAVERKLVALLVCDLHERTAGAQHDPEDSEQLLAGGLGLVQAEVARHGGLLVEVVGTVLFLSPHPALTTGPATQLVAVEHE